MSRGLDWQDLNKLSEVLRMFERVTERNTAVGSIVGGFTIASVQNIEVEGDSCDHIDITMKWGIKSDCEDTVHTEHYRLSIDQLQETKPAIDVITYLEAG